MKYFRQAACARLRGGAQDTRSGCRACRSSSAGVGNRRRDSHGRGWGCQHGSPMRVRVGRPCSQRDPARRRNAGCRRPRPVPRPAPCLSDGCHGYACVGGRGQEAQAEVATWHVRIRNRPRVDLYVAPFWSAGLGSAATGVGVWSAFLLVCVGLGLEGKEEELPGKMRTRCSEEDRPKHRTRRELVQRPSETYCRRQDPAPERPEKRSPHVEKAHHVALSWLPLRRGVTAVRLVVLHLLRVRSFPFVFRIPDAVVNLACQGAIRLLHGRDSPPSAPNPEACRRGTRARSIPFAVAGGVPNLEKVARRRCVGEFNRLPLRSVAGYMPWTSAVRRRGPPVGGPSLQRLRRKPDRDSRRREAS